MHHAEVLLFVTPSAYIPQPPPASFGLLTRPHATMADPSLRGPYYRILYPPHDQKARGPYYHYLSISPLESHEAREAWRRQVSFGDNPTAWGPPRQRLWEAYNGLFQQTHDEHRLRGRNQLPKRFKDPYVLANQYQQYMDERSIRVPTGDEHRVFSNPYYENLLANRRDPPEDANDPLSRAIRYAKMHHECFYEVGQVDMIVEILDRQRDKPMQPSLEDAKNARLGKLYRLADLVEELDADIKRNRRRNSDESLRTASGWPPSPHSTAYDGSGSEKHETSTTSLYYLQNQNWMT